MEGIFKATTFGSYKIRIAKEEDAEAIILLLMDTANWLKSKGSSQWNHYLNEEESENIRKDISNKVMYIAEVGGRVVATFTFSPKQTEWDKELWGNRDDCAYYLHRFSVNRDDKNQNIGRKILDWIDENILLEDGYVRLDCVANNSVLNQFYQDAGFSFIGYVGEGENKYSTYQKEF